jgi:hypothetical protein
MNAGSPLRSFVLVITLAVAGCATGATGAPPSTSSVPSPTAAETTPSPASAAPSGTAPTGPETPTPSACGPSAACSSPSPSAAVCPSALLATAGVPGELIDVRVDLGSTGDRVTFVLGASSVPSPSSPSVTAGAVAGPFVADPSGLPLEVAGRRFVAVTFREMTLVDETGTPAYSGETELSAPGPGVRAVVRQSAYEGVTTWLIGYDATACPSAEVGAATVTVVVPHD